MSPKPKGRGFWTTRSTVRSDLANRASYQITSLLDNPILTPLVDAAFTFGLIDTLQPTSEQPTEALLGDPTAPDVALIPFALFSGAGPVLNLTNLIP